MFSDSENASTTKFQQTKNFFESRCKNEKRRYLSSRGGSSISTERPPPKYNPEIHSKVSYLKAKLEKTSMDIEQTHVKKKFRPHESSIDIQLNQIGDTSKVDQNSKENTTAENEDGIEKSSILTSLLLSEPDIIQKISEHYRANSEEHSKDVPTSDNCQQESNNANDSYASNQSVIINSDVEGDNEDPDRSRVSINSIKSDQLNGTFNVNSDSDEDNLPDGWSVAWSNGRKYYIGNKNPVLIYEQYTF